VRLMWLLLHFNTKERPCWDGHRLAFCFRCVYVHLVVLNLARRFHSTVASGMFITLPRIVSVAGQSLDMRTSIASSSCQPVACRRDLDATSHHAE